MVVSILGCGWYGRALARALIQKGITVNGSATSDEKLKLLSAAGMITWLVQFNADSESFDPGFFHCDVLVIAITPKFRKGELEAYLLKISRITNAIRRYDIDKVIYISSTGVYGEGNCQFSESDDPAPDTQSGAVLLEAEKKFQAETGFNTTIIRFGGLVGPGRHPGRFFAGKSNIPNGRAPVNLIHLQDCVGITMAVIAKNAFGYLFNACLQDHPAKQDFYGKAAAGAGLTVPKFLDELKSYKIIISNNLSTILNYRFSIRNWKDCTFDEAP